MRRRGALRAALPLLILLLAWHARPVGSADNPLARLWAKVPPRAPLSTAPAAHGAGAWADPATGGAASGPTSTDLGAAGAAGGAGARAGVGRAGGGAGGAAAAAAAGAVTAAVAAPWKPNTRPRGRPINSKDKKPRKKRGRCESAASHSTAPTASSRGRLPGARGPRPGSGGNAKWSSELKGYAIAVYDRVGSYQSAVVELLRTQPENYGVGRAMLRSGKPAAALSPQLLGLWVEKRNKARAAGSSSVWFDTFVGGRRAGAGRHRLVPAAVMQRIVAAWTAVLSTKKTLSPLCSCALLLLAFSSLLA